MDEDQQEVNIVKRDDGWYVVGEGDGEGPFHRQADAEEFANANGYIIL